MGIGDGEELEAMLHHTFLLTIQPHHPFQQVAVELPLDPAHNHFHLIQSEMEDKHFDLNSSLCLIQLFLATYL